MRDQTARKQRPLRAVDYPESDREPIGETDFHITTILYLREALRWIFRAADDVYVAANMLLYYEEGNPQACRAPDVFAVRGVAKADRRTYRLWVEGVVPSLVIEVTSKKSQVEDLGTKRGVYELLGVREYLVFDPLGEYLEPRFQAFCLEGRYYRPAPLGENGDYRSVALGVTFVPEATLLRVIDPETGEPVPFLQEAVARARAEAHRAEAESKRAEAESKRVGELEVRLKAYRDRFGDL